MLYEMLTGEPPFTGATLSEVVVRQLRDRPDVARLPAALAPIVARALEKDPAARYQSIEEFTDALSRATAGVAGSFDPRSLTSVAGVQRQAAAAPLPPLPVTPAASTRQVPPVDAPYGLHHGTPATGGRGYAPTQPAAHGLLERIDRVSFKWPLRLYALFSVLAAAAALMGVEGRRRDDELAVAWTLFCIAALPFHLLLIYRWWSCLPAGWRRTTPARAAGFMLIPFFNLYWMFVAYCGLAADLEGYSRARSGSPAVPAGLRNLGLVSGILAIVSLFAFRAPQAYALVSCGVVACRLAFAWNANAVCQKMLTGSAAAWPPAVPATRS
jgi:hypothetical protein